MKERNKKPAKLTKVLLNFQEEEREKKQQRPRRKKKTKKKIKQKKLIHERFVSNQHTKEHDIN